MPSPFPGMDPYLEAPDLWPDVHQRFASEISSELNLALPEPYYARLEMRSELGVAEDEEGGVVVVPDVVVLGRPRPTAAPGGAAVLERPRREVSPGQALELRSERVRHHFVEIRDARRGHKLVTLIEILSPSNKRPGADRDAYAAKQREVLGSDANLIEIDLLRGGRRVIPGPEIEVTLARIAPPSRYLVLVSRAWRRGGLGLGYEAFPFGVREWMPCIPVPLKEGEAEVPLDLQYVFNAMYDRGPYRRAVDYGRPPESPLAGDDAAWAEEVLRGRP